MTPHTIIKHIAFSCLLLGGFIGAFAQINTAVLIDPHVSSHGARYLPSKLGTGCKKGEVHIFNNYTWVSNSSIGYKFIETLAFSETISDADVKTLVGQMKKNNNIFFGTELQLLSVSFKINRKKKELFTMRLDHRERVYGNLQYAKGLFKFALEGNKQFAGTTESFGPVRVNAAYLREYNFGVSVPINIKSVDLNIRPAITAKVIQGIANVYTTRGNVTMYTEPDGRYIDFNFDYNLNHSLPNFSGFKASDVLNGKGLGWGLDAGVGVTWKDFLSFDVAAVDLGKVTYSKNVKNYSRQGTYRFEGAEVTPFDDANGDKQFNINFSEEIFDPVTTEDKYKSTLGGKFIFHTTARFKKTTFSSKRDSTKTTSYFQHHLALTYVQGLETAYNATTQPYFSLAYMYSLKNILNLGLSLGFNGYNKFKIGPFISVKGGPFVFAVGSNNLTALIAPKVGTGVDAYFNIGFNF